MDSRARILIVDDEPDTLGLVNLTLKTARYEVHTCPSGGEAINLLRREAYDLVVLDIMMPDISGFDVVRALQGENIHLPPIIFLTARNLDEDREIGLSLGAKAFLVKPATRGQLLDAIDEALSSS